MAPFPEEVDVFTIPHSRMKQLVHKYCDMLSSVNFSSDFDLEMLLQNLCNTFAEFKAHEQIENELIMKRLKHKLKALQITNTAVCNCHSDNRLTEMIEFFKSGLEKVTSNPADRINYGKQLRETLEEFTEQFLPHMKEEEEVFQPLLIKYFPYEELKIIKEAVIQKHIEKHQRQKYDDSEKEVCEEEKDTPEEEKESSRERSQVELPPEVLVNIFSYLNPRDLARCAQVCKTWNTLTMDGQLWKAIYPVQWAQGNWSFSAPDLEQEPEDFSEDRYVVIDDDADIDETYDSDSSHSSNDSYNENIKQLRQEARVLVSITKNLLPKVGKSVETLSVAHSKAITNGLLSKMLKHCPNVQHLDVKQTNVSDTAFKRLGKDGCGSKLKTLILSGCANITDYTLIKLSQALSGGLEAVWTEEFCCQNNKSDDKDIYQEKYDCHAQVPPPCGEYEDHAEVPSMQDDDEKLSCDSIDGSTTVLPHQYIDFDSFESQLQRTFTMLELGGVPQVEGQVMSTCQNCPHQTGNVGSIENCSRLLTEERQIAVEKPQFDVIDVKKTLEYLDLSGCCMVTDVGLRALASNHGLPRLRHLDLSGCSNLSGQALTSLVDTCHALNVEELYYCDNLLDGPYPEEASGCQNLECSNRFCCRSGK
ncbi:F-box/LRR-repeat protein 5 [Lingula anatina]|uniref:F-box/LRR-repeat protein 5 n=1 Tax=Lingula anatina TaxID=7574 RepID=A0A1S3JEV7_LINAN|nr:F-box/LRR-repeat protein 5 [Lingula anatina]|eukprot:XP_013408873.1 F-box/LRR-repeat protein 5 [Lingula anatina]